MSLERGRSLRQYLMGFGAALLFPVLVLAAVLVWQFARAEQRQNEQRARAAAEQIVAAVDRELAGLQAAAQALASSAALRAGGYERFQRRAAETIRALPRPQDYAVIVRDLTGQQVVNTRTPWGASLPKNADGDHDQEVIETKRPYVRDLFVGPTANRPILSVRVPVLTDEHVTHVLAIAFEPAHLVEVLREQNLPSAWTATVLDRNNRIIARSQGLERFLGTIPPEDFGFDSSHNGKWEGVNVDGVPVLGAVARSRLSGWRVFVGVPRAVIQAPLWRSLLLIGALAAILLGLSFALAFWFGNRLAKAIRQLTQNAQALGRGRPVNTVASRLKEADEVAEAMARAHVELTAREAALKASEARLRATAENAAVGIVEVDRHGRFIQVNEAQCRLTGHTRDELIGRHFAHATRGDFVEQDIELFQRQVAGELDVYTLEKPHIRTDASEGWARVSSTAVRNENGEFLYAVRIVEDISERKHSEAQQLLLINELNHRVKNTLATVQSLAWQTLQPGKPSEIAREQFQKRLLALSRTHNLLNAAGWRSARLLDVIKTELEPYEGGTRKTFHIAGPDLELPPRVAVALGMTVHELATNAVKHGALSSAEGGLQVSWSVQMVDGAPRELHLNWNETQAAANSTPLEYGFGVRLMKRLVESELGGRISFKFEPNGLLVTIQVPLGAQPVSSENANGRMSLATNRTSA